MSILITGYSLKAPKSDNVKDFYYNLKNKIDMTSESKRYNKNFLSLPNYTGSLDNIDKFDNKFFNYNIKQVDKMDISIRLLLEITHEALLDSGLSIDKLRGSNTGVYIGHCFSDYFNKIKEDSDINGYELINSYPSMAAGKISHFYDLKGPSIVLDTACSSSLVALSNAVKDIELGIVERAIVAGVSLTLDPKINNMFNKYHMLSPTGKCHVFDSKADGYCRSESIGVIIIESERVCNNGYAKIEGILTNSDGYTPKGITYPNYLSQQNLANKVFNKYNIDKDNIGYIEAHGTGTNAGDSNELKSLGEVYMKKKKCPIGSLKSNMGHSEGASGIMSLIKCLIMYEKKEIYANLNFETTHHKELLDKKFRVPINTEPLPDNCYISISNYGFSGTNAFLVISPGNITYQKKASQHHKMYFSNNLSNTNISSKFWENQILLGNDKPFKNKLINGKNIDTCKNKILFLLTGQGTQWENMGKELLEKSEIFKDTIKRLSKYIDLDILDLYMRGDQWFNKKYSPLGIVSYQIGLVNILKNYGITADKCIGHSLGEICCGYIMNHINEEQAIKITEIRCKCISKFNKDRSILVTSETYEYDLCVKYFDKYVYYVDHDQNTKDNEIKISMDGLMTFVSEEKKVIESVISDNNLNHICIACYNNPKGYTISGEKIQVEKLKKILNDTGEIFMKDLNTDSIAYHSPILKYFEDYLNRQFLDILGDNESIINNKWISTNKSNIHSYKYYSQNIMNSVFFEQAIGKLEDNYTTIEIGPKSFLNRCVNNINPNIKVFHIINNEQDEKNIDQLHIKLWKNSFTLNSYIDKSEQLYLEDRYFDLWNHEKSHRILTFEDFKTNNSKRNNYNKIIYTFDNTELKWLDGHVIEGKHVFPASAYIYMLWKINNFSDIKIENFVVDRKINLNNKDEISFRIDIENDEYKFYHNDILSTSAKIIPMNDINLNLDLTYSDNSITKYQFYNYIKKIGYDYYNDYQNIESYDYTHKTYKIRNDINIIAYLDTFYQAIIVQSNVLLLPISTKSIILTNFKNLKYIISMKKNPEINIGNNSIYFIDIKFTTRKYKPKINITTNSEIWINYGKNTTDKLKYFKNILKNIVKEYEIFHSNDNLWDSKIETIVKSSCKKTNKFTLLITNDNTDFLDMYDYIITSKPIKYDNIIYVLSFDENVYLYSKKRTNYQIINNINTINISDFNKEKQIIWKNNLLESGIIGGVRSLKKEGYELSAYYLEDPSQSIVNKDINMPFIHQRIDKKQGIYVESNAEKYISKSNKFNLIIEHPGNINSLTWVENNFKTKVSYSALNFRDVMRSYGKLKEKDTSIGLEFSGYNLKGEKIFGVGKNTIGSYCQPFYTYPLPESMSLENGASIMITYLTAYYCLFEKCRLKKGDTVLIHSGSGGVGMSCINLCKSRGICIYTTCSEPKRDFLKSNFGLSDNQIGNSRSLDFKKWILKETNNLGVNAVINSLSEEFQLASIKCLSEYGNFCEIGKYDIINHSVIDQFLFEKNISFHVIDLLPMLKNKSFHNLWNQYLSKGFSIGEIKPLPIKTYTPDKVKEAFRYMGQGKHIGKILINFDETYIPEYIKPKFNTQGVHLISGGLGGIGLELSKFLSKSGAEKLILLSRSGIKNQFQQFQIDQIECEIEILIQDVSKIEYMENIEMIWHLASSSRDSLYKNMTDDIWNEIYNIKVGGYLHLRKKFPNTDIITFGSVASLHGNIGQVHYSYSNNALKNIVRNDSNGYIIDLGPVDNIGMAINSLKKINKNKFLKDYKLLPIDKIFELINNGAFKNNKIISCYVINDELNDQKYQSKKNETINLYQKSITRNTNIFGLKTILEKLADCLGGDISDYDSHTPLISYGLDSLSTMEFLEWIKEQTDIDIVPSFIEEETTVDHIYQHILENGFTPKLSLDTTNITYQTQSNNTNDFGIKTILEKLADCLGGDISDYDSHTPLISYGLDSLSTMEFLEWIKEQTDIDIAPSFIEEETTVDNIYQHILEKGFTSCIKYSDLKDNVTDINHPKIISVDLDNNNDLNISNNYSKIIPVDLDSTNNLSTGNNYSNTISADYYNNNENNFNFLNNRLSLLNLWKKKDEWITNFLNNLKE